MHTDKDYALALQLQEQYDKINNSFKKPQTPTSAKVVKNSNAEGKINLGSPSLEVRDPTPNVHDLFVNFNRTFFWCKLNSVAVRWSKRMYSCAGICSYHPRNGFCDIALSEPLLKLRPRKDLVETLLHEMIHAYLFVTNNDRDRDGHGPNFLSHMHRINKAANLHITVYHTFHDEVHLYQTHWWRCDGPCQKQKPYYGLVKRSSNRAPGPNDFWWKTHQFNCGGTFIKIKEPEKKTKKSTQNNKTQSKVSNIRSVKDLFNNNSLKNKENNFNPSGAVKNGSSTVLLPNKTDRKSTPSNNIKTVSSLNDRKSTGSILSYVTQSNKMNQTMVGGVTTLSAGNRLSDDGSVNDSKSVLDTVRNSWLQRFSTPATSGGSNKRPCDAEAEEQRSNKIIKLENPDNVLNSVKVENNLIDSKPIITKSECDIKNNLDSINKPSTSKDINNINSPSTSKGSNSSRGENDELSLYYSMPPKLIQDCNQIMRPLYGQTFTLNEHHFKTSSISSELWQKASDIEDSCKVQCPVCDIMYPRSKIEEHVNHCIECGPSTSANVKDESIDLSGYEKEYSQASLIDLTDEDTPTNSFVKQEITAEDMQIKESPKSSKSQQNTNDSQFLESDYCNCPLCNIRLNRNEADEHLEQCLSMTFVSEPVIESTASHVDDDEHKDSVVENNDNSRDDLDESQENNSDKVCCPCCYKLFQESEINRHLDDCIL